MSTSKADTTSQKKYTHQRDPIKERIYNQIGYYRRKREDGKDWIPKETSILFVFCKEHGLDPIQLIEGKQTISCMPKTRVDNTQELHEVEAQIKQYRRKWLAFQTKPWLPKENSNLHKWCQEHNIDPAELIESNQPIMEFLLSI